MEMAHSHSHSHSHSQSQARRSRSYPSESALIMGVNHRGGEHHASYGSQHPYSSVSVRLFVRTLLSWERISSHLISCHVMSSHVMSSLYLSLSLSLSLSSDGVASTTTSGHSKSSKSGHSSLIKPNLIQFTTLHRPSFTNLLPAKTTQRNTTQHNHEAFYLHRRYRHHGRLYFCLHRTCSNKDLDHFTENVRLSRRRRKQRHVSVSPMAEPTRSLGRNVRR